MNSPVCSVQVDHRGADVLVPQNVLERAAVAASAQRVRGERVTEGVACRAFGDAGPPHGALDRALDGRHVQRPAFCRLRGRCSA